MKKPSAKTLLMGSLLDPWLLCMARGLHEAGATCDIVITPRTERPSDSDEVDCFKWLRASESGPFIEVREDDFSRVVSSEYDLVFVIVRSSLSRADQRKIANIVMQVDRSVALLRFYPNRVGYELKTLLKEFRYPFLTHFKELWTEDVRYGFLTAFLRKTHRYFGVFPHQRVLTSLVESKKLTKPVMPGERPCLFCYAGTNNKKRQPIAQWIERHLVSTEEAGAYRFLLPGSLGEKVYWFNDEPDSKRARDYGDFLKTCESAWFTLCLPGHTGMTHRVLEAICRGGIPVMEESIILFHGLPLIDGKNVILVKNGNWQGALERIYAMPVSLRSAMQSQVLKLASGAASLPAIYHSLVEKLAGASKQG